MTSTCEAPHPENAAVAENSGRGPIPIVASEVVRASFRQAIAPVPLQITCRKTGMRATYAHGDATATHATDALRRLCRKMVAAGLSGPAEVRSEGGKLLMTVLAVEEAAKWVLTEDDRGIHLRRYRPFDPAILRAA